MAQVGLFDHVFPTSRGSEHIHASRNQSYNDAATSREGLEDSIAPNMIAKKAQVESMKFSTQHGHIF